MDANHIIEVSKQIIEQAPTYLAALDGLVLAIIGIAVLIPGEQPEKALRSVAAFIEKFSRK